jgi:hypothetical protein
VGAFFALTTKNLEPTPLDAAGAGWWTPRATTVGGEIVQRRVTDDVGDVIDTAVRMIPQTSRGRIDLMPTSGFGGRNKVRISHTQRQMSTFLTRTSPSHSDLRGACGRERVVVGGVAEAGAMVYSRFLELPQLGSSHGLLQRTAALSGPLDPVTASLEAKWLGVSELVLNATAEAKRAGVTTPHPYAENSICFVEPMVRHRSGSISPAHHR